jgi:hypothetical protein
MSLIRFLDRAQRRFLNRIARETLLKESAHTHE